MDECDEIHDPFNQHFLYDLSPELLASASEKQYETSRTIWPSLKQLAVKLPKVIPTKNHVHESIIDKEIAYAKIPSQPVNINTSKLSQFYIKSQITGNVLRANLTHTGESELSRLQLELLSIIHEYKDLYFTDRTFSNAEEIRFIYSLHAINHALKTRLKITHHNARISDKSDIPDEYRDQGLVRPKILIVVPFKDSAFRIIKMMSSILLGEEKQNVVNKKRFYDEFSGADMSLSQKKSRPEDYEKTFCGNIDDNFKIGISVTKKSLKLYSDFYSSDIIVASPLGLRIIIGAEGERDRDYDFLSSIEILIMDQVEVLLMQNWDHVLHAVDHLNLQPTESHGTDFSRVRSWALNGWTKYYRQNIVLSAYPLVEISAMVNKRCSNYAGCIRTINPVTTGAISQVIVSVPQIFYRLSDKSASETIDERFEMFTQKILPQCQDNIMKHVLIYIPSYFDFVRLRNYFKSEAISSVQICEYSKDRKVAQARDMFFHNEVNYMLYSERFHFFMRRKIRGICNLIFYQLPTFPHFYSELCNLIQAANQNPKTTENAGASISVIYSKFDAPQLAAIVSTDRAARILSSDEEVHVFTTDDT